MTDKTRTNPEIAHPIHETNEQPPLDELPKYEELPKASPAPVQVQPQPANVVSGVSQQVGRIPVERTCPNCNQHIVTRVEATNGLMPWLVCGGLALLGCWLGCCLIPFCIDDLKDITHYCPKCGNMLGQKKLI